MRLYEPTAISPDAEKNACASRPSGIAIPVTRPMILFAAPGRKLSFLNRRCGGDSKISGRDKSRTTQNHHGEFMKRIHILGVRPFKSMLAIATTAAILSVSSIALAQATNGASSSSGMSSGSSMTTGSGMSSTDGAAGTSTNGATKGTATKKGMKASNDMSSAPADMQSAMSASDQQMKSMQSTGDIDRDYAMIMRAHHQGAVDMSKSEIAHGKDPEMKRLARKIMANNKKEMAQFDKWLNKQQGTKGASAKGATSKGSMSDTKSATP